MPSSIRRCLSGRAAPSAIVSSVARSAAFLLSIIPAVSLLSGCASTARPVYTSAAAYDGPPMTAKGSAGQHVIVMTAPTSGWSLALDLTRPALDRTEVFLTATRPDPAKMQAQMLVTHEVGTTVSTSSAMDVYARVLGFGERAGEQAYQRVMAVSPIPK